MTKSEFKVSKSGTWIWKNNDNREPNLIVFVHGYTGNPDSTWQKFPHLIRQIGQGFESGFEVASFGYESGVILNRNDVHSISQMFKTFLDDQGYEARNIFIISHSLGGIVARSLLVDTYNTEKSLFEKIKQIHFIGVPHDGAALAPDKIKWFSKLNPLAANLTRKNTALLKILKDWNQIVTELNEKERLKISCSIMWATRIC